MTIQNSWENPYMSWVFIVVRNNAVEQTRTFSDFWQGAKYTDHFIALIDPNFGNGNPCFPAYNRGEFYSKDGVTVGLYKDSSLGD